MKLELIRASKFYYKATKRSKPRLITVEVKGRDVEYVKQWREVYNSLPHCKE